MIRLNKNGELVKCKLLCALAIMCGLLSVAARPQSEPAEFPLAGDWDGTWESQGIVHHLTLHMNSTPAGKMTALLDLVEEKIGGMPAIGGSFDGTHLVLRFFYWKPSSSGDLEYKVSTYEAIVNESASEMTGVWKQEDTRQVNFKRATWHAKIPKPAPPSIFDGDWTGVEYEARGIQLHFTFHIRNTEEGLMVLLDCPEERFKGALASNVTYDKDSRQISITLGQSLFVGKMTADGKSLDTSMTEPGFHFLIHFDRLTPAGTGP